MSPTGHKFSAGALALALALPVFQAQAYFEAALYGAGAMLGARAPDWSEMAKWIDGRRYSLLPHRGPTHWPGTWIVGLVLSWLFLPPLYQAAATGFFAAALLHLVMDILTPTGIPLWHPFARKRAFRVYRSGAFLPELLLTLLCWISALGYLSLLHPALAESLKTGI